VLRIGIYQREARSEGMTSASKRNKPPVYSFRHHAPALARCVAEVRPEGLTAYSEYGGGGTRCRQKIAFWSNLRATRREISILVHQNEE
jgi:hypothetical protein